MISGNFVAEVDSAFLYVMYVSIALMIGVTATMLYFVFRYHHTRNEKGTDIHGNVMLEVIWTVGPTLLVMTMFWAGYSGYNHMESIPDDAMEVEVTARMWGWNFTYPNGATSDTMYVPVDQPIDCKMESVDVLHSFYIPEFRVKKDCVPDGKNRMWFTAPAAGQYQVFCTEYCGLDHAYMYTAVVAMERAEFDAWYNANAKADESTAAIEIPETNESM
ncbi:MAG: cytochrome c oxidase subunit II [Calditrichia bacterium]